MSHAKLLKTAKDLWNAEWSKAARSRKAAPVNAMLHTCPSPTMIETLVDLLAEDPSRSVAELEPIIHRMLFESQFVDEGGDSVILDAFDSLDVQAQLLVRVLEEVRQLGLREGLWSTEPVTPMMFG